MLYITLREPKVTSPVSLAKTAASGKENGIYTRYKTFHRLEQSSIFTLNPFAKDRQSHSKTNEAVLEILDCVK